jgi:acetyl-CoA acetyltransferase
MNNVYIIDYVRTPISKLQGGLSEVRADDLAAIVIKEVVARNPEVPVEKLKMLFSDVPIRQVKITEM